MRTSRTAPSRRREVTWPDPPDAQPEEAAPVEMSISRADALRLLTIARNLPRPYGADGFAILHLIQALQDALEPDEKLE